VTATIGGIEFDNVTYDAEGDVLYLHVGDPSTAVDFDETPEGHAIRFDASGRIVGLTLVRPRHLLETAGEVKVTLPDPYRLEARELASLLA